MCKISHNLYEKMLFQVLKLEQHFGCTMVLNTDIHSLAP